MTPEQKILSDFGFNLRGIDPKYEKEFKELMRIFTDYFLCFASTDGCPLFGER